MKRKIKHDPLPFIDEFVDGTVTMSGKEFTEKDIEDYFGILRGTLTSEDVSDTSNNYKLPLGKLSITNGITSTSGGTGKWNSPSTGGGTWAGGHTYPYSPSSIPSTHIVPAVWTDHVTSTTTESTSITIYDEDGCLKRLSIAEVSRYYAEALEYRKIKRFAKLFPMIKELLNELLVAMKLSDPLDDDELDRLEEELKESKKKK